jgi:hypothetical protein
MAAKLTPNEGCDTAKVPIAPPHARLLVQGIGKSELM